MKEEEDFQEYLKRVKLSRVINKNIVKWEKRDIDEVISTNARIKEKYDFNSKDFFEYLENSEEEYARKFFDCLSISELFSESYYSCVPTIGEYYNYLI
jgi:hypothetical protein